jgi:hypothetical protein
MNTEEITAIKNLIFDLKIKNLFFDYNQIQKTEFF